MYGILKLHIHIHADFWMQDMQLKERNDCCMFCPSILLAPVNETPLFPRGLCQHFAPLVALMHREIYGGSSHRSLVSCKFWIIRFGCSNEKILHNHYQDRSLPYKAWTAVFVVFHPLLRRWMQINWWNTFVVDKKDF